MCLVPKSKVILINKLSINNALPDSRCANSASKVRYANGVRLESLAVQCVKAILTPIFAKRNKLEI